MKSVGIDTADQHKTHYLVFLLCDLYFSLIFQYDCLRARNSCEGRGGKGITGFVINLLQS